MADKQLTYDPKKVKVVPTDQVRPNTWNPKEHDPEGGDFRKVVRSVAENGLRAPIVVREVQPDDPALDGVENPGAVFEIIDGEQRYRAAVELGYPKVVVYNEGALATERAQALTIWYQQQVPFDEVMEARLASALAEVEDLALPYTDAELEHLHKLARFDFDDLDGDGDGDDAEETRTLHIKFTVAQFELIKTALEQAEQDGSPTDARTIEQWAREYLQERGGLPQ